MTNKEAIEILLNNTSSLRMNDNSLEEQERVSNYDCAFYMAIKALEQKECEEGYNNGSTNVI